MNKGQRGLNFLNGMTVTYQRRHLQGTPGQMKARWDWVGVRLHADVCSAKAVQCSLMTVCTVSVTRSDKGTDVILVIPTEAASRQSKADMQLLFSDLWRRNGWRSVSLWGETRDFLCMSHGWQQQHVKKHDYETGYKKTYEPSLSPSLPFFLSNTRLSFPLNLICQRSGNIKPKQMKLLVCDPSCL